MNCPLGRLYGSELVTARFLTHICRVLNEIHSIDVHDMTTLELDSFKREMAEEFESFKIRFQKEKRRTLQVPLSGRRIFVPVTRFSRRHLHALLQLTKR